VLRVGALVSLSGRYAVQGAEARLGLELWARERRVELVLVDDGSSPEAAARLYGRLAAGCRFVVGPYGGDSMRAVAKACSGSVVWNQGAAADDVQRLPGVVSVASPASS
jgi:ABC-type branched-subunit amino acid transport system substrate-binding protein